MSKAAYPKTTADRAKLYLHCMVEIKERFGVARGTLASDLGPLFANEICSIQFRHIVELIAIACLAAQGDFRTQRAFREEYSPAKIFNALRELYPNFFPQPSTVTFANGVHHMQGNANPLAYSEAQVTSVWSKSGDDLHRASVEKYLRRAFTTPRPLDLARQHITGLTELLRSHVIPIQSSDDNVLLDVRMEDEDGNVVANFLTIDDVKETITVEAYKSKLVDR